MLDMGRDARCWVRGLMFEVLGLQAQVLRIVSALCIPSAVTGCSPAAVPAEVSAVAGLVASSVVAIDAASAAAHAAQPRNSTVSIPSTRAVRAHRCAQVPRKVAQYSGRDAVVRLEGLRDLRQASATAISQATASATGNSSAFAQSLAQATASGNVSAAASALAQAVAAGGSQAQAAAQAVAQAQATNPSAAGQVVARGQASAVSTALAQAAATAPAAATGSAIATALSQAQAQGGSAQANSLAQAVAGAANQGGTGTSQALAQALASAQGSGVPGSTAAAQAVAQAAAQAGGAATALAQRAMAPKRKLEANGRQRPVQDDDKDDDSEQTSDSGEDTSSGASGSSFPSEDEEEDSGSAADSDEDQDVSEIRVEFQFFGPEEKDFLGLKTLLSSYLNGEQYDSTGLVDAIISEGDVGSVVKTDEDDDPIAVMAVLNTTQYKDAAFMQQLRQFMLGNASAYSQQLAQSLDGPGTGLLINERLLNSPPSLAPPLLQFLLNEIKSRAAQDDEDAKNFQYQRLLLMTRIFVDSSVGGVPVLRNSGAPAPSAAGVTKHAKPGSSASRSVPQTAQVSQARTEVPQSALVFTRPEDEYLHAQCDWHFIFPVPDRPITKDGLVAHRLVMQVQMAKVLTAQKELDEVVGNMAAGFRLDRDTNFQRIGESMQRPLELCSWRDRESLPPVGKEYQQGYKLVNDRLPKGRQRLHWGAEYRPGIDGP
ncbi:hypothetical protein QJQ45_011272 [Haematococcus lacustris]|nr:hypothetical protein QJQ45_011272 [Haematococcus lacustris]